MENRRDDNKTTKVNHEWKGGSTRKKLIKGIKYTGDEVRMN